MENKKTLREQFFVETYKDGSWDETSEYNEKYIAWLEKRAKRLEEALDCTQHEAMNHEELPDGLTTYNERDLHQAMGKIYRIAHVASKPVCFRNHEDWEKEFRGYVEMINEIG